VIQNRYDVIVVGAGLTGRIAAYLLASRGRKVFALLAPDADMPASLPCTESLKQLLPSLGFTEECRLPAEHLQLITPETRLDINGTLPLGEELQREFPSSHRTMENCLQQLGLLGRKLETLLLRKGRPPSMGLAARLAFQRRLWLGGQAGKQPGRDLATFASGMADGTARLALLTLFGGLSLKDPARLTVAEAALLWQEACCCRMGDASALPSLLEQRIRELRGRTEPLSALDTLLAGGARLKAALMKDGRLLEAGHFLIDRVPDASILPGALTDSRKFSPAEAVRWHLTDLDRQPSALLAPRIVLAGTTPVQISLLPTETGNPEMEIRLPGTTTFPLSDSGQLRRLLKPVLPFADFRLSCQRQPIGLVQPSRFLGFPRFWGPWKLGPNTLVCPNTLESGGMPGMGPALLGWLAANALAPASKTVG
jgi:hypothetical protein